MKLAPLKALSTKCFGVLELIKCSFDTNIDLYMENDVEIEIIFLSRVFLHVGMRQTAKLC